MRAVEFVESLADAGISFFTGVPDSLLSSFSAALLSMEGRLEHIIAANEGNAVALALGHHLASGEVPLVYLQNSGLGNAINPLVSLADEEIYSIPMLLVIGWRGEPGTIDEPQHSKQGAVTEPLLDLLGIKYITIDESTSLSSVAEFVKQIRGVSKPAAIVVKKKTFDDMPENEVQYHEAFFTREEAIKCILEAAPSQSRFISTTGKASRELFELRQGSDINAGLDFLTVGGMGHASQIACSYARAKPELTTICLDGDGACLMHLGALAINGIYGSENFVHIVLNNASHDSVGGQPTSIEKIDLCHMAKACAYKTVAKLKASKKHEAIREIKKAVVSCGPVFLEVPVRKGARKDLGRPTTTPLENKLQFMS